MKSNKSFEFILYEDTSTPPSANCCHFDRDEKDDKAIYIMLLMLSAELGGKKVWYPFGYQKEMEYVSFNQ